MPPHPDKRCRCGKQTWRKSEIEMLELRLKTFAAVQLRKDRWETVGLDTPEGVSAGQRRKGTRTVWVAVRETRDADGFRVIIARDENSREETDFGITEWQSMPLAS